MKLGGRQGCKHGPVMFNVGYELPLSDIRSECRALGLVSDGNRMLWGADEAQCRPEQLNPDIVFVDDAVETDTPYQMFRAIPTVMPIVWRTFQKYGLSINMSKGKSEAFVSLVGKRQAVYKKKLQEMGGKVPFPDSAEPLRVVEQYVNMGSTLACDRHRDCDVAKRISSAMVAYAMVLPILGCKWLPVAIKLQIGVSIVICRLLYNFATFGDSF